MTYGIIQAHNTSGNMSELKLRVDAMASHDITYVGIIQTARASGLEKFPLPYVLTNCHNSLCAVGGTINEDDHLFGLSAARKYGGEFVPAHQAVIHQYMRERYAAPGALILCLGQPHAIRSIRLVRYREGGPELVKQLLNKNLRHLLSEGRGGLAGREPRRVSARGT
jgi:aconitate hydratase